MAVNVLMLGNWPDQEPKGGPEVHTINLVKFLAKRNDLKITILNFGNENTKKDVENVNILTIKRKVIYYMFPALAVLRLLLIMKDINPDIVHVQGSNLTPYAICSLIFGGSTKIMTVHGYWTEGLIINNRIPDHWIFKRLFKAIERIILNKQDVIIAVDNRIVDYTKSKLKENSSIKLISILNGVDIERFNPTFNNDMIFRFKMDIGIPYEGKVIFNAKALTRNNGQEFLIQAMPHILIKRPESYLILAGDGALRHYLQKISNDLGVDNRVILIGQVSNNDIPKFLEISDVVVIPSIRYEGAEEASSIFLVEAMSMKKPVIASSIGGLKETISHGVNGLLIPDRDPTAIGEAVISIIDNKKYAIELGEKAREYVISHRTWNSVADRVANVYLRL